MPKTKDDMPVFEQPPLPPPRKKSNTATWIIVLVLIAIVFFLAKSAAANGGNHTCQGGHNCNDDGDVVEVVPSVGGDSTRLFSVGGSDMEISGCIATFSRVFGLWQDAKVVPDCEAMQEAIRLDGQGQHEAAAKMRCGTKLYRKRFGKGRGCIDAVVLSDSPVDVPNLVGLVESEKRYVAQEEEIKQVREEAAQAQVGLDEFKQEYYRNQKAAAARYERRRQLAEDTLLKLENKDGDEQPHD